MTREEMTDLMQFIAATCPQQRIDRATAIAWYEVIGKLEFADARAAVIAVIHSQAFIAPADILREASRARRAHPSDRAPGQALAAANRRELAAAGGAPPTEEFLTAKAGMLRRMRERDQAAYLADRQAQQRAKAWLDYAVTGRQPVDWPLMAPASPRWQQLPGDPPELRAWLARQPRETA